MDHPIVTITKRHYDIILKQGIDNLPEESGGFVGGDGLAIKAILPIFNQHIFNKTDTFSLTSDDIARAHRFFKKHGLNYICVYHTHPKGDPYPSSTDIKTGQKYHLIIGLRDESHPVMCAYQIQGTQPIQLPVRILENQAYDVVDIHKQAKDFNNELKPRTMVEDAQDLSNQLENIKDGNARYSRLDPKSGFEASDFSTFA